MMLLYIKRCVIIVIVSAISVFASITNPSFAYADDNIIHPIRIDRNGNIHKIDVKYNINNDYDVINDYNRSVIGNDDRYTVSQNEIVNNNWAKRTVLINFYAFNSAVNQYEYQNCTGTLVSLNTVLTAGHCIIMQKTDENGILMNGTIDEFSKYFEVIPGAYTDSNGNLIKPYGTYKVDEDNLYIDSSWLNNGNPNQDWGILKLTENVPEEVGYYNVLASNRDDISGMRARISGYPSQSNNNITMYTATGSTMSTSYIDNWNASLYQLGLIEFNYVNMVPYNIDMTIGESGAGVIANPAGEEGIIAINSRENQGGNLQYPNIGVRITPSLRAIINSVK